MRTARLALRLVKALASVLIALVVVGYNYFHSPQMRPEEFKRLEWRERATLAGQNDPGCVRGGMARYLVESGKLVHLSEVATLELLGTPDTFGARQLRYSLGQCHWDWRHSQLRVTFNPDGFIASATIAAE